ncbi:MAG: fumarylacetoacetate hydrolase family protein, partial [Desulfobacterales bacterium]|nr:fumarylacetoacetate hydrolase family protein [Desulfobacterales bacterium]
MQIIRFENQDGLTCLGTDYDGSSATPLEGGLYSGPTPSDERMAVGKLLPPVDPRAILCIGLNYRRHAGEIGMDVPRYPVVFMKNPAAAAAHGDAIVLPAVCREKPEVDYEAELGVVIGRPAKNVSEEDALSHVLGYTVANDVSARRWQKHAGGGQWVRGKSFDTFCPFGPALVTRDEVPDPQDLDIRLSLNGRILQQSNTGDMIFPVARIISYL